LSNSIPIFPQGPGFQHPLARKSIGNFKLFKPEPKREEVKEKSIILNKEHRWSKDDDR
jgi:hypothetical protein